MNTQQALRKCFNYFLNLNHQPGFRDKLCVYYANGDDPVRCAIGCLIPARYQEQAGEVGGGIDDLFLKVPVLGEFFENVDYDTLYAMQDAHDKWAMKYDLEATRETFLDYLQLLMCFHKN